MSFALIRTSDNRVVDIQDVAPANWPVNQSFVVEGNFDRNTQLGWTWNGTDLIPPPPPSAEATAAKVRKNTFVNDPVRRDVVTHLKNDDLAQIEAFVRGKIDASAVTDLATAKACMQRIENAVAGLAQAVALVVRE